MNFRHIPVDGVRVVGEGEDLRAPDVVAVAHLLSQECHRTLVVGVDLSPLSVQCGPTGLEPQIKHELAILWRSQVMILV